MSDAGAQPPARDRLAALPADVWAVLVPHARGALADLPDDPARPGRGALRGRPTGKLAGGRGREALLDLLSADPQLWLGVRSRLSDHDAEVVDAALASSPAASRRDAAVPERERTLSDLRRRAERDRQRLKVVRDERDDARRQAAGAESRAAAVTEALERAERRIDELRARIDELTRQRDQAAADRERAIARERRRREAEVTDLEHQLRELRRVEEERREHARRRAERADAPPATSPHPASTAEPPRSALVPGRPSRLPDGVVAGTREAVELYLHRGRRVLVDGYNLTKQHQGAMDLEAQRTWIVRSLGNLARSRGVRPTVVFDGTVAAGRRGAGGAREVSVRFTEAGITADDEIILELEATDEPILVVTDDRELADRARGSGADVIATHELVWLL